MRLTELAELLPDPADYYRGVSSVVAGTPTNVLLFSRDRAITGSGLAYHHRHVMICCLEGRGTVIVDGLMHVLSPGQGLLVFPFQAHDYGAFDPGPVCWLFATFDYGDEACLGALRNAPQALDERCLDLVESLAQSFLAERSGEASAGDVLGLRIAELLARLVRRAERPEGARPAGAASPRQEVIRRAVAFAHENIARRVTIADVAAHVCLSPSRLRAVFLREMGTSLGDFLLRNRINRACALLGQSEMNISEVAAACGFDSIYSFSRAFRRRMGRPPSQYRSSLLRREAVRQSRASD
ncbi:MAG TPA: AraC family transcriptional regulator [Planctomycetota bacterium]|nr:AraC family transcriptional regulator [Planctomycetota bacterium]